MRGVAGVFVNSSLLLHEATQLVVDPFTHVAQVVSCGGVVRIENDGLAIRLNGILVETLCAVGIADVQVQFVALRVDFEGLLKRF